MVSDLTLIAGIDIPFPALQVNIHQPTIKEISYIGEETLRIGCELLIFTKDKLSFEDREKLADKTDFDILLSVLVNKEDEKVRRGVEAVESVLFLLFPNFSIEFSRNGIILKDEKSNEQRIINNEYYPDFKQILLAMFVLKDAAIEGYRPRDAAAQKIADKLKRRKNKVAEMKHQDLNHIPSLYGRYMSILSVGNQYSLSDLLNYTVYQLDDIFKRYGLKMEHDIYLQAKMAGAKDLQEVENWMKNIHE